MNHSIKIYRLNATFIDSEPLLLSLSRMIVVKDDVDSMMAPLWSSLFYGMTKDMISEDSVIRIEFLHLDIDQLNFEDGYQAGLLLTMQLNPQMKNDILALIAALMSVNPIIARNYILSMDNTPLSRFFACFTELIDEIVEKSRGLH